MMHISGEMRENKAVKLNVKLKSIKWHQIEILMKSTST